MGSERTRKDRRRHRKDASGKFVAKDSRGRRPKEAIYSIDDNIASAEDTAYYPQASGGSSDELEQGETWSEYDCNAVEDIDLYEDIDLMEGTDEDNLRHISFWNKPDAVVLSG